MKKTFLSFLLSLVVCILPAYALFEEGENAILISNLQGSAGDSNVVLTWNATTDLSGEEASGFVVHVGETSVAEGLADDYDNTYDTDTTTFSVNSLTNGKTYYFAVHAIGQDGSISALSEEIAVVPTAGDAESEEDTSNAPQVMSAIANNSTEVVIEFSEDIILPEESPELSFSISEANNESAFLLVWTAEYDKENEGEENETNILSRVVLSTDEQEDGKEYNITVSALITDTEGNPIKSGVTDSASFIGTSAQEEVPSEEETPAEETPTEEETPAEETPAEETADEEHGSAWDIIEDTDMPEVPQEDTTPPLNITNLVSNFKEQTNNLYWM